MNPKITLLTLCCLIVNISNSQSWQWGKRGGSVDQLSKTSGGKQKEVSVLGIPKYFTPNGDGYNDYWNIDGVNQIFHSKSTIQIFDRYGKLIKQLNPLGSGWDGKFNGQNVLSDDYWYIIKLEEGRIIRGNFSLKR